MPKCRITVLKREFFPELATPETSVPCRRFTDGQVMVLDKAEPPDEFCQWAWNDIRKYVMTLFYGGDFPEMGRPGAAVVCCTDGIRPVIFKIERIDD